MPIQHVNRKGDTYHLHEGRTKTGRPKFHFSKKSQGDDLCDAVPDSFEVYENPHGQVYCRRAIERLITDMEVDVVEAALRACKKDDFTLVEVKGKDILIWESNARELAVTLKKMAEMFGRKTTGQQMQQLCVSGGVQYHQLLKFTLVDSTERLFAPSRWCWRGEVDDWVSLITYSQPLPDLMQTYSHHIGEESFVDLM